MHQHCCVPAPLAGSVLHLHQLALAVLPAAKLQLCLLPRLLMHGCLAGDSGTPNSVMSNWLPVNNCLMITSVSDTVCYVCALSSSQLDPERLPEVRQGYVSAGITQRNMIPGSQCVDGAHNR